MTSAVNKLKWDEFHRRFLNWWNKPRNDQRAKADRAYERSISILQKRYGYTREEATLQLNKHYSGPGLAKTIRRMEQSWLK